MLYNIKEIKRPDLKIPSIARKCARSHFGAENLYSVSKFYRSFANCKKLSVALQNCSVFLAKDKLV